jgi:3',5'-cyclic AMP phosphodiesterase CpdA
MSPCPTPENQVPETMRTILHMSDLHFGYTDPALLQPLVETVHYLAPDLIVISGDLTQRARSKEFHQARRFLDTLPQPQLVVPGNHDVPLYNIFARFLKPLAGYRRHITKNLEPVYADEEMVVIGINTARSLTFKNGRINLEQIAAIRSRFDGLSEKILKVVVTHHPFDLPATYGEDDLVGRAPLAMATLADCGADLLLAGHMHTSHAGSTEARYGIPGYAALAVQAGTATSTRSRGELNSFNLIRATPSEVIVERYIWVPTSGNFFLAHVEVFKSSDGAETDAPCWVRKAGAAPL